MHVLQLGIFYKNPNFHLNKILIIYFKRLILCILVLRTLNGTNNNRLSHNLILSHFVIFLNHLISFLTYHNKLLKSKQHVKSFKVSCSPKLVLQKKMNVKSLSGIELFL